MFVFLIISAELVLVYTAFWYLYLREPAGYGRITASLWGTYIETVDNGFDPSVPDMQSCQCSPLREQHYMSYDHRLDFELDRCTNHIVPVAESGSVLVQVANKIDRTFSKANIRP